MIKNPHASRADTVVDHNVRLEELQDALSWLKKVSGVDDEYLAKWDVTEWMAWYRAMACLTMTPNPSVPTWLAEIIASDWSKDWSRPWPSVGQLWPTAHDWFVEDQQRDDFHLRVAIPETESGTPSPDLQQLHQAWRLAAQRPDTAPLVMLDLLPQHAMAKNVTGEISAFTVVGQRLNPALTNQLSTILSRPSQRQSLYFDEDLRHASNLETNSELVVLYETDWTS